VAEGVVIQAPAPPRTPSVSAATPQKKPMLMISGRRKAAMLCVALGPAAAAHIFKHLSQEMIEKLTVEMARTPAVDSAASEAVLEEVVETAYARGYIAEGGISYARDVLERAVGSAKAQEILARLATVIEQTPFEYLRGTPADQIYAFLRGEHPQMVALVIANLPTTELAAKVMQLIPPVEQADVATRIALMGQTAPDVVKEVARVMKQKLETVLQTEYAAAGGAPALAQILNSADRGTERNILEYLAEVDPELAEEVRSLLFVFEDILKLDDRSVQLVLKEVDTKDIALALRGASDEVKDRLLANMSQRGAEMLKEEMEYMPPQRRKVVEEAQSTVVAVVRKLEETGAIFVARDGNDADEQVV
jgi:flagellar motor switch protein FliG